MELFTGAVVQGSRLSWAELSETGFGFWHCHIWLQTHTHQSLDLGLPMFINQVRVCGFAWPLVVFVEALNVGPETGEGLGRDGPVTQLNLLVSPVPFPPVGVLPFGPEGHWV